MKDFFDEDFPLSEKQAREREEAEAKALEEALPEAEEAEDFFADHEDEITEALVGSIEDLAPVAEIPDPEAVEDFVDIFDEPIEGVDTPAEAYEEYTSAEADDFEDEVVVEEHLPDDEEEGYTFGEPVEYDPLEAAPLLDLDDDEPLDDNFLPEAPIIIDDDLGSEIEELNSKLDDMERAVEAMTKDLKEREAAEPTYEFDERYFAEEETTAYKYPEMVKKQKPKAAKKETGLTININKENLKTAAKVGAAVAGVAIVAKLLGGKKK